MVERPVYQDYLLDQFILSEKGPVMNSDIKAPARNLMHPKYK